MPATKSNTWPSPSTAPATNSDTWTSPSTAPTTKSDTWTSPSTAPTTQSDTWTSPSIACAYHEKWHLTFTKYCAYHENWHLTFTKYCAYHEKWHLTFTKYCACHTEWLAGLILVTYETSFPMRAETNVTLQTHQILRLPRKMTIQHLAEICGKQLKRHFQCAADPRPFRDRSETVPRPFASVRNPPRNRGYSSRSGRTVCIEKYNISRSGYLSKFHQVLRLPRKVTLELHQVLHLPRKLTLELHQVLRLPRKVTLDLHQVLRLPHRMTRRLDPRHIWNVTSNARRNKCHPPNSPNIAPATQNDHPTSGRNLRKTAETSFPMHGRSETVPRPFRDRFRQSATRHATEVTLRAPDEQFVLKNTTFRAPAIFPNFTKSCAYHAKWHLNFTKYCAYHENWHLNFTKYCAYHEKWHLTFTKYCACHTEWLAGLILVTYETSFPMRAETNVTLQTHQILRLPRKMTIQHLAEICGKQLKRHFQCTADPRPFRDRSETVPRPFPSVRNPPRNRGYFFAPDERFVLKNTTFRVPAIFPNFTKSCAYHEKWRLNFTKYCAYHAKWHLNFTKYCAYHENWHLNFTKYCAYHEKWHLTFTKYCACHTEWLAIVIDSTVTQRFYLTLLLIESTVTQRLYLTLLLRSDSTWLYYYAAILIDSTITQWF